MRRRRYKAGKNILRGADVVGRPVAKHTPQTSARQRQQHRCEYTINSAPKRGRCTMRGAHICTDTHEHTKRTHIASPLHSTLQSIREHAVDMYGRRSASRTLRDQPLWESCVIVACSPFRSSLLLLLLLLLSA